MEGWVKLPCDVIEKEWFNNKIAFKVFIYLLLSANEEEVKWENITIPAGSLVASWKSLSKALNFSEHQIIAALNKLKSANEIKIKRIGNYYLISINNWERYREK